MFYIFSIFLSIAISIIGIYFVSKNIKNYGEIYNVIFIILAYIFGHFLFFTFLILSIIIQFEDITFGLIFFKLSLLFRIISLLILGGIHISIFIIKKMKYLPQLILGFIGGILIGSIFFKNSIYVYHDGLYAHYKFNDIFIIINFIIFLLVIVILSWINQIINYFRISNKKLANIFWFIVFYYSLQFLTYLVFILNTEILWLNIFIIAYLIPSIPLLIIIIKKPNLFALITSQIYNFIIFHRSGILLYSYDFKLKREFEDSILKGSILIGINHILSNFIDKKEQINLIKMKDRDIVLEFNNEYGYAILLTCSQFNPIIERSLMLFMEEFTKKNKEYLEKLNNFTTLIDISIFKDTKDLITEFFGAYITNK